jgi:ABC-type glutathione transport system ATPase component
MTPDLPAGSTIAVLGAEGTGKTALASALAQRLPQHCIVVADDGPSIPVAPPRGCAFTLLMGLDLPLADAEALQRREQADALLRDALAAAGRPFAVVHGRGPERLDSALRALGLSAPETPRRAAAWSCDKCSDPGCEHRLFTALLRRRAEAGTDS